MKKLLVASGAALVATPVLAQQTFGDLVSSSQENALGPAADLVLNVAWVAGILMLLFAAFKLFKSGRGHHGEGMQGGAMLGLVVGGAMLVAFPAFVGVGPASIFGGEADTASTDGQLRSLN